MQWLMLLSGTAASWGEFCTIPFDTAKGEARTGAEAAAPLRPPPAACSPAPSLCACVRACVSLPAVRLQIQDKERPQYRGLLHVMTSMLRDEGLTVPWRGVSAGIQRQMAFAPIRIGLYEPVRNFYVPKEQTGPATILQKIAAGLTTSSAQQRSARAKQSSARAPA